MLQQAAIRASHGRFCARRMPGKLGFRPQRCLHARERSRRDP
jgi:hypothetical protein